MEKKIYESPDVSIVPIQTSLSLLSGSSMNINDPDKTTSIVW